MYGREQVELFLLGREDGMTVREAAGFAGVGPRAAKRWSAGALPHSYTGAPRRGTMAPSTRREEAPVDESERAAYEAAMTENQLLRAVLDDLKGAGSPPASISKSSYEYHRARLGRDRDADIRALVVSAFEASGGAYGYRRVHAELARSGVRRSEKRVRRVMAEEGLEARSTARSPHRWSSYAGEDGRAVAPNLLLRDGRRDSHDFSAARPGERVVTDVTEFRLGPRGPRCHLSAAVDLFDGRVVAWSAGPSPSKALVQGMLGQLEGRLEPGCVVHSDRGWHYRTPDWVAACEAMGARRSMSRRGHSPDNAACEAFFGRLKVELFHLGDWEGWTPGRFAELLGRYIEWYNSGRLKSFGAEGYDTIDGRRARLGLAA